MDNFNPKDLTQAAKVSSFMMKLCEAHYGDERYERAIKEIAFGDLAYAAALNDWHSRGCPKDSIFSYAEGEEACPCLMEFRAEISAEFGLPILTAEEAKARKKLTGLVVIPVHDWGPN